MSGLTRADGGPQAAGSAPPCVSVIVPTYNAAELVERAIRSILDQDYRPLEVLVIDDCSTDDTAARVGRLAAPEVRLIRLPQNAGAAGARNAGIAQATGELLAFLDADDCWRPGKLSRQVACLRPDPEVSLVACDYTAWKDARALGRYFSDERRPVQGADAWKTLLRYSFVTTSCVLTRTALVRALGGFSTDLVIAEDQDLWIRLALAGKVAVIDEPLVDYHEVKGSLTKVHRLGERDFLLPMLERHVTLNAARLSPWERRTILGLRYFTVAWSLYRRGYRRQSLPVFLKAAAAGHRPLRALSMPARLIADGIIDRLRARRGSRSPA